MMESSIYSLARQYVVLTVAYSAISVALVELLLWFWRIRAYETRVEFRLMVLLLPPLLALLYPLAWSVSPLGLVGPPWQLLATETLIQTVHRYFPWLWYFVFLVLGATTVHFLLQVVVPVFQWSSRGARGAELAPQSKPARAYHSVVRATGLSPRLVLVESEEPMAEVRGLLSPSVVVSTALANSLDEAELESVLAHEFAHLRRADVAVNWLTTVLRALMFFNPLATLVHTLIGLDSERACDDAAISVASSPLAYASALIKIHRACSRGRPQRIARDRASLAIKVACWEMRALHSFTVERINRVLAHECPPEVPFAGERRAMVGAALVAILFFVK